MCGKHSGGWGKVCNVAAQKQQQVEEVLVLGMKKTRTCVQAAICFTYGQLYCRACKAGGLAS